MNRLKTYSKVNRLTAAFTAVIFLITSYPSPQAQGMEPSASLPAPSLRNILEDLSAIQLPKDFGKIQESYRGSSDKVAVLVQDAHSIPDAQRNIQNIIGFFQKEYDVSLVGVEGTAAQLDPQIFHSFPDRKKLREVFEEYYERGELTGGTAAAIFSRQSTVDSPQKEHEGLNRGPWTMDRGLAFEGLEDWPLYERGVSEFLKALKEQKKLSEVLDGKREALKKEKEKFYSKELLEIDTVLNQFHKNQGDLVETVKVLAKYKKPEGELGLILKKTEGSKQEAGKIEFEVKRIAREVEKALKTLKLEGEKENSKTSNLEFQAKKQLYQTSQLSTDDYGLYLRETIEKNHLPIKLSLHLHREAEEAQRLRDLEGTRLFKDFERYGQSVKAKLFRNEKERILDQENHEMELLTRFASLELSQEDWEEVKRLKSEKVKKLGDENFLTFKLLNFSTHFNFYEIAEQRDTSLFKNTLALMKSHQVKSSLVIAGGFHAEGLTQKLKANGISYVLVMPEIKTMPEHSLYLEHMKGNVSWKNYFEVKDGKVNLYEAFVRSSRDRLLKLEARSGKLEERNQKASPFELQTLNFQLAKLWRDQIIRDLAAKNELTKAHDYTRFIDELSKEHSADLPAEAKRQAGSKGSENSMPYALSSLLRQQWLSNIHRFIDGLKNLKSRGEMDIPNVTQLLNSFSTAAPALAGALSNQWVAGWILGFEEKRSEVRTNPSEPDGARSVSKLHSSTFTPNSSSRSEARSQNAEPSQGTIPAGDRPRDLTEINARYGSKGLDKILAAIRKIYLSNGYSDTEFNPYLALILQDVDRRIGIPKPEPNEWIWLANLTALLARSYEPSSKEPADVDPPSLPIAQSVAFTGSPENQPSRILMRPIEPDDEMLIDEWKDDRYRIMKTDADGRSNELPLNYEDVWHEAAKGKRKGFAIFSEDQDGKRHLEGWQTYEEYPVFGLYFAYIEIAPWNRGTFKDRKFKGLGSVLKTRIIEESVWRGYEGRVFSHAGTPEGKTIMLSLGAVETTPMHEAFWEIPKALMLTSTAAQKILREQAGRTGGMLVEDESLKIKVTGSEGTHQPEGGQAGSPAAGKSETSKTSPRSEVRKIGEAVSGSAGIQSPLENLPKGIGWQVQKSRPDGQDGGHILTEEFVRPDYFSLSNTVRADVNEGTRQSHLGLLSDHLPAFAKTLGIGRIVGGDSSATIVEYPDLRALNERIHRMNRDKPVIFVKFWDHPEGEAPIEAYLEHWRRGETIYTRSGPHHFHDVNIHLTQFLLMPKELVQTSSHLAEFLYQLNLDESLRKDQDVQKEIRSSMSRFVRTLDVTTGALSQIFDPRYQSSFEDYESFHQSKPSAMAERMIRSINKGKPLKSWLMGAWQARIRQIAKEAGDLPMQPFDVTTLYVQRVKFLEESYPEAGKNQPRSEVRGNASEELKVKNEKLSAEGQIRPTLFGEEPGLSSKLHSSPFTPKSSSRSEVRAKETVSSSQDGIPDFIRDPSILLRTPFDEKLFDRALTYLTSDDPDKVEAASRAVKYFFIPLMKDEKAHSTAFQMFDKLRLKLKTIQTSELGFDDEPEDEYSYLLLHPLRFLKRCLVHLGSFLFNPLYRQIRKQTIAWDRMGFIPQPKNRILNLIMGEFAKRNEYQIDSMTPSDVTGKRIRGRSMPLHLASLTYAQDTGKFHLAFPSGWRRLPDDRDQYLISEKFLILTLQLQALMNTFPVVKPLNKKEESSELRSPLMDQMDEANERHEEKEKWSEKMRFFVPAFALSHLLINTLWYLLSARNMSESETYMSLVWMALSLSTQLAFGVLALPGVVGAVFLGVLELEILAGQVFKRWEGKHKDPRFGVSFLDNYSSRFGVFSSNVKYKLNSLIYEMKQKAASEKFFNYESALQRFVEMAREYQEASPEELEKVFLYKIAQGILRQYADHVGGFDRELAARGLMSKYPEYGLIRVVIMPDGFLFLTRDYSELNLHQESNYQAARILQAEMGKKSPTDIPISQKEFFQSRQTQITKEIPWLVNLVYRGFYVFYFLEMVERLMAYRNAKSLVKRMLKEAPFPTQVIVVVNPADSVQSLVPIDVKNKPHVAGFIVPMRYLQSPVKPKASIFGKFDFKIAREKLIKRIFTGTITLSLILAASFYGLNGVKTFLTKSMMGINQSGISSSVSFNFGRGNQGPGEPLISFSEPVNAPNAPMFYSFGYYRGFDRNGGNNYAPHSDFKPAVKGIQNSGTNTMIQTNHTFQPIIAVPHYPDAQHPENKHPVLAEPSEVSEINAPVFGNSIHSVSYGQSNDAPHPETLASYRLLDPATKGQVLKLLGSSEELSETEETLQQKIEIIEKAAKEKFYYSNSLWWSLYWMLPHTSFMDAVEGKGNTFSRWVYRQGLKEGEGKVGIQCTGASIFSVEALRAKNLAARMQGGGYDKNQDQKIGKNELHANSSFYNPSTGHWEDLDLTAVIDVKISEDTVGDMMWRIFGKAVLLGAVILGTVITLAFLRKAKKEIGKVEVDGKKKARDLGQIKGSILKAVLKMISLKRQDQDDDPLARKILSQSAPSDTEPLTVSGQGDALVPLKSERELFLEKIKTVVDTYQGIAAKNEYVQIIAAAKGFHNNFVGLNTQERDHEIPIREIRERFLELSSKGELKLKPIQNHQARDYPLVVVRDQSYALTDPANGKKQTNTYLAFPEIGIEPTSYVIHLAGYLENLSAGYYGVLFREESAKELPGARSEVRRNASEELKVKNEKLSAEGRIRPTLFGEEPGLSSKLHSSPFTPNSSSRSEVRTNPSQPAGVQSVRKPIYSLNGTVFPRSELRGQIGHVRTIPVAGLGLWHELLARLRPEELRSIYDEAYKSGEDPWAISEAVRSQLYQLGISKLPGPWSPADLKVLLQIETALRLLDIRSGYLAYLQEFSADLFEIEMDSSLSRSLALYQNQDFLLSPKMAERIKAILNNYPDYQKDYYLAIMLFPSLWTAEGKPSPLIGDFWIASNGRFYFCFDADSSQGFELVTSGDHQGLYHVHFMPIDTGWGKMLEVHQKKYSPNRTRGQEYWEDVRRLNQSLRTQLAAGYKVSEPKLVEDTKVIQDYAQTLQRELVLLQNVVPDKAIDIETSNSNAPTLQAVKKIFQDFTRIYNPETGLMKSTEKASPDTQEFRSEIRMSETKAGGLETEVQVGISRRGFITAKTTVQGGGANWKNQARKIDLLIEAYWTQIKRQIPHDPFALRPSGLGSTERPVLMQQALYLLEYLYRRHLSDQKSRNDKTSDSHSRSELRENLGEKGRNVFFERLSRILVFFRRSNSPRASEVLPSVEEILSGLSTDQKMFLDASPTGNRILRNYYESLRNPGSQREHPFLVKEIQDLVALFSKLVSQGLITPEVLRFLSLSTSNETDEDSLPFYLRKAGGNLIEMLINHNVFGARIPNFNPSDEFRFFVQEIFPLRNDLDGFLNLMQDQTRQSRAGKTKAIGSLLCRAVARQSHISENQIFILPPTPNFLWVMKDFTDQEKIQAINGFQFKIKDAEGQLQPVIVVKDDVPSAILKVMAHESAHAEADPEVDKLYGKEEFARVLIEGFQVYRELQILRSMTVGSTAEARRLKEIIEASAGSEGVSLEDAIKEMVFSLHVSYENERKLVQSILARSGDQHPDRLSADHPMMTFALKGDFQALENYLGKDRFNMLRSFLNQVPNKVFFITPMVGIRIWFRLAEELIITAKDLPDSRRMEALIRMVNRAILPTEVNQAHDQNVTVQTAEEFLTDLLQNSRQFLASPALLTQEQYWAFLTQHRLQIRRAELRSQGEESPVNQRSLEIFQILNHGSFVAFLMKRYFNAKLKTYLSEEFDGNDAFFFVFFGSLGAIAVGAACIHFIPHSILLWLGISGGGWLGCEYWDYLRRTFSLRLYNHLDYSIDSFLDSPNFLDREIHEAFRMAQEGIENEKEATRTLLDLIRELLFKSEETNFVGIDYFRKEIQFHYPLILATTYLLWLAFKKQYPPSKIEERIKILSLNSLLYGGALGRMKSLWTSIDDADRYKVVDREGNEAEQILLKKILDIVEKVPGADTRSELRDLTGGKVEVLRSDYDLTQPFDDLNPSSTGLSPLKFEMQPSAISPQLTASSDGSSSLAIGLSKASLEPRRRAETRIKEGAVEREVLAEYFQDRLKALFSGFSPVIRKKIIGMAVQGASPEQIVQSLQLIRPEDGQEIDLKLIDEMLNQALFVEKRVKFTNRFKGDESGRSVYNFEPLKDQDTITWQEAEPYLKKDREELEMIAREQNSTPDQILRLMINRMEELLAQALEADKEQGASFANLKIQSPVRTYEIHMVRKSWGDDVDLIFSKNPQGPGELRSEHLRINRFSIALNRMGVFYKGNSNFDKSYPSSPLEFWREHMEAANNYEAQPPEAGLSKKATSSTGQAPSKGQVEDYPKINAGESEALKNPPRSEVRDGGQVREGLPVIVQERLKAH
ncbi:MAG: hypothetical protein EXS63_03160, partial [Candidatus Omnitrophica bacterium]|nr:hypothetical protein [Candidatus Omnitrophota bacterium]